VTFEVFRLANKRAAELSIEATVRARRDQNGAGPRFNLKGERLIAKMHGETVGPNSLSFAPFMNGRCCKGGAVKPT